MLHVHTVLINQLASLLHYITSQPANEDLQWVVRNQSDLSNIINFISSLEVFSHAF